MAGGGGVTTVVTLPRNLTLEQFKQEIQNLYYGRDNDALHKLLDEIKVNHADQKS